MSRLGAVWTSRRWLALEEKLLPKTLDFRCCLRDTKPLCIFPQIFCQCLLPSKNAQGAPNQAARGTSKTMVVPSDVCGSFIAVISKKSINFKQPPSAYSLLCCRVPHFGRRVIVGARLGQRKAKAAFFS